MRRPIRLAASVVVVAIAAGVLAPTASAAELDLEARLAPSKGHPAAIGHSEYERNGATREVEVTVRTLTGLAGVRVRVFVAGQAIGTMLVSRSGRAHIERSTTRGQSVPVVSAGSTVRVRTLRGALIAGGVYRVETDD